MQRDGIDVGVSRAIGLELRGAAQFRERFIETLEPNEREPERIVQPGIAR